jgi:hypothetical protein
MKAPKGYNIWTQKFDDAVHGDYGAPMTSKDALELNTAGITISSVSGTAIAGARTSATRFTRTSGVHIDRVILPLTGATGTFTVGETVTEAASSSTGVVESATTTQVILKTISKAFTGSAVLTGGTSAYTATGGTAVNCLTPLAGKLAWSHTSGTTGGTGNWVRIKSVAAAGTYFDIIATDALDSVSTAVIISNENFPAMPNEEEFARQQMDITL